MSAPPHAVDESDEEEYESYHDDESDLASYSWDTHGRYGEHLYGGAFDEYDEPRNSWVELYNEGRSSSPPVQAPTAKVSTSSTSTP